MTFYTVSNNSIIDDADVNQFANALNAARAEMPLTAQGAVLPTGAHVNPPVREQFELSGGVFGYRLIFEDGESQRAMWQVTLPRDLAANATFRIMVNWTKTTGTGGVRWRAYTSHFQDGGNAYQNPVARSNVVTTNAPNDNTIETTTLSLSTISGMAAGGTIRFILERQGGSDAFSEDVHFLSGMLQIDRDISITT